MCNIRKHEFLPGQMDWMNRDLYSLELTERGMFFAAASDILRYEILYNFGGVYMDVDLRLTEGLGELDVEADGVRVAIESDKRGSPYSGGEWAGRDRIKVPAHENKCFYLMNNIVASHPESRFVQALRQAIRFSFDLALLKDARSCLELDRNNLLGAYRKQKITPSTLDMTGPNIIRDVMYLRLLGTSWEEIPRQNVIRLVDALDKASRNQKPEGPCARTEAVWRDDEVAHQPFWRWVADNACFPMRPVNWNTPEANESDCRKAGNQLLEKDKAPKVNATRS